MLYNLHKIQDLSGDDEEFIKSVISVFLDETPDDLVQLEEGIKSANFDLTYQFSHKIKPNVDLLGMESTREKVFEIETISKNDKDLEKIKALFAEVQSEIKQVIEELKSDFNL